MRIKDCLNVVSSSEATTAGSGEGESIGFTAAKLQVLPLLLSIAGFATSVYALYEHVKIKAGGSVECDVNDLVSCSKVIGSTYGELFGIPLGGFGMAYFGIILGASVLPALSKVSNSWIKSALLFFSSVGAVVSMVLAYLAYFKVGAVCMVCSAVHVISLLIFAVIVIGFIGCRFEKKQAEESAFLKLISISLAFVVPSLIVGLLSPSLFAGAAGGAASGGAAGSAAGTSATGKSAAPALSSTTYPAELLTFSKSDFVGNGQDYRRGNDEAKVVLFMYSDLECPHCKVTSDAIQKSLSVVGENKVLFIYRNYPLSNKCNAKIGGEGHAFACDLALASRCAGQQGKFWEYKDWAFTGIDMSPGEKQEKFSSEGLKAQASKLGLDATRFAQCFDSKVELAKIREDIEVGTKLGLTGTPLLILNGRKYQGQMTPDGFVAALQGALAQAGQ